jgi:hypothetical protein
MAELAIRDVAANLRGADFRPVEPLPSRPSATFDPLNAPAEFVTLCERFKVRKPTKHPDRLIKTSGRGGCLEPLLSSERAAVYFDTSIPADDGDMVIVDCSDRYMQALIESVMAESAEWRANWIATYAPNGEIPNGAIKILRHGYGKRWLTCNQTTFPLDFQGTILGVVRHIEVDGTPVFGSLPRRAPRPWWLYTILAFCGFVILFDQLWRYLG